MNLLAYLPDLLYWEGAFHEGMALTVHADGTVAGAVPAAEAKDPTRLRGRALLPGLVNAHSHAFQRLIRGQTEYASPGAARDDFWSWRELMYRAAVSLEPEDVYLVSRQAFIEMAVGGVSTVGEFHYLHHQADGTPYADPHELARQVIRAARDAGLRISLLRVGYARSGYEVAENPRQRRFFEKTADSYLEAAHTLQRTVRDEAHVRVGLAPHSVRAMPESWLRAVAAQAHEFPAVHMHVSEQPAEIDACLAEHGMRPVELCSELGLLGPKFTAVHAIHLNDDEVALLGQSGASVCACPTTEANLGDGVIPADALYRANAKLCLGSDSQATVDLLLEARALENHLRLVRQARNVLDPRAGHPEDQAKRLFHAATAAGAQSLGWNSGQLVPGAQADFFTVALEHPSLVGAPREHLLASIVFGAEKAAVRDVAVAGRLVVTDGHHPLQETSGRAFTQVARRLLS